MLHKFSSLLFYHGQNNYLFSYIYIQFDSIKLFSFSLRFGSRKPHFATPSSWIYMFKDQ